VVERRTTKFLPMKTVNALYWGVV